MKVYILAGSIQRANDIQREHFSKVMPKDIRLVSRSNIRGRTIGLDDTIYIDESFWGSRHFAEIWRGLVAAVNLV